MSNVDFDFIAKQEGKRILQGYVPDAEGSKSGVTIATGFDLGQRSLSDLAGLPEDIIDILKPFLGFKGAEAADMAGQLELSDDQARIVDEFSHKEALDRLRTKWMSATGESFDDLPMHKATPIASVAFQYGDLESKTPAFWNQITKDDWTLAERNLRDFGDRYDSRRNREADYFNSGLSEDELESKKKFDRDLDRAKQMGIQEAQIFEGRRTDDFEDLGTQRTDVPRFKPDNLVLPEEIRQKTRPTEVQTEDFSLETDDLLPVNNIIEDLPIEFEDSFVSPEGFVRPPDYQIKSPYIKKMMSDFDAEQKFMRQEGVYQYEPPTNKVYKVTGKDREDRIIVADPDQFEYDQFMPTFGQMARASWRQNNVFPSLARLIDDMTDPMMKQEEGYHVTKSAYAKRYIPEEAMIYYDHVRNDNHLKFLLENKREDLADMATLEAAPDGVAGSLNFAISMAGPTVFAPLAPIKFFRRTPIMRFLQGAASTSISMGISQSIISSQRETKDNFQTLQSLLAAGVLGGGLAVAFGKGMTDDMILQMRKDQNNFRRNNPFSILLGKGKDPLEFDAGGNPIFRDKNGDIIPRSAGASASPEHARNLAYAQHRFEALEETGVGIEGLGWNPFIRLSKSDNVVIRSVTNKLIYGGGVMQKKVRQLGQAMDQSVEEIFKSRWNSSLSQSVDVMNRQYLKYRQGTASLNPVRNQMTALRNQVEDIVAPSDNIITEVQFRHRVSYAMRRGDVDSVNDAATPFVEASAKNMRKHFDGLGKEAIRTRVFEDFIQRAIEQVGDNPQLINALQEKAELLRTRGLTINTAESYLPRVFRIDKIDANPERFLRILSDHFMSLDGRISRQTAENQASLVMDSITRRKPFIDLEDTQDYMDFLKNPSSSYARSLKVPDELVEEFLENDVQQLAMHYTKTMGMDIELARAFGSFDLRYLIRDVTEEHNRKLEGVTDAAKRAEMNESLKRDIDDLKAVRDRLRGTYGASKDPHAMSSRAIRAMKSINVLALMGGAVVSSIPDIVRVAMVEGFGHAYSKGFATFFDRQAFNIRRMARNELVQAGVAADATLGLRAHALADTGDMFGSRYALERSLNNGVNTFFTLNFLNPWNHTMKMFAGNVTVLKMTNGIMRDGGWQGLSKLEKEKFLKNGISKEDYTSMRDLIREHGELKYGSQWLPNTEAWRSPRLRQMFRVALNQNVDRMIVTPGAGDRALWTSTELGSLITQFKSFGQGAAMRLTTAGLQEKDGAFWTGAFLMVALAGMVNEFKRAQYDMTSNESADQKLINAIDRSGIMGWFFDANNTLEKITDYNLGIRPAFTNQPSYPVHHGAKANALLGPSASLALNAGNLAGDVLSGNVDQKTFTSGRFLFPTGNIPYLDPIYDGLFDYNNYSIQSNVNRQQ